MPETAKHNTSQHTPRKPTGVNVANSRQNQGKIKKLAAEAARRVAEAEAARRVAAAAAAEAEAARRVAEAEAARRVAEAEAARRAAAAAAEAERQAAAAAEAEAARRVAEAEAARRAEEKKEKEIWVKDYKKEKELEDSKAKNLITTIAEIETFQTVEKKLAKQNLEQDKTKEEKLQQITKKITEKITKKITAKTNPTHVSKIIPFEGYDEKDIHAFIEQNIPSDAVSLLSSCQKLSDSDISSIAMFIIQKYIALVINDPRDDIGNDPQYTKVGIAGGARNAMLSCIPVCNADAVPAGCCVLSRDFPHISNAVFADVLPQRRAYVTANPDIVGMMRECRVLHTPQSSSDPMGADDSTHPPAPAPAPAPAPFPGDGMGDQPFPSVLIGGEILYTIGPILINDALFGRPLIMVRIHNYKTRRFPNGIYFWTYPSFSEGGLNRAYFTIDGKQIMKGPDYTLTTFIIELLQVIINNYYTEHCFSKEAAGNFSPQLLRNIRELVCFFGEMIHLQDQYPWDIIAGLGPDHRPPNPIPPNAFNRRCFNRHCYAFHPTSLNTDTMNTYLNSGVEGLIDLITRCTEVPATRATPYIPATPLPLRCRLLAKQFIGMKEGTVSQGEDYVKGKGAPFRWSITTVTSLLKESLFGGADFKILLSSSEQLFSRWSDADIVQGPNCIRGFPSLIACVVSGGGTNTLEMACNLLVDYLAPREIVKRIIPFRVVNPVSTLDTEASKTVAPTPPMLRSRRVLDGPEQSFISLDFRELVNELSSDHRMSPGDKYEKMFVSLPISIQETILKISIIFLQNQGGMDESNTDLHICLKALLDIPQDTSIESITLDILLDRLKVHILKPVFKNSGYVTSSSVLDRLRKIAELSAYRYALVSGIFEQYLGVPTFPMERITTPVSPLVGSARVSCSFLNEFGQYVDVETLDHQADSYDFSEVFRHPNFNPYIFSLTRKSFTFPKTTLDQFTFLSTPPNVNDIPGLATIPVKVHTKMFLIRLVFSTIQGAIQVVICVSSTVCIATPRVVTKDPITNKTSYTGPSYPSFGVDAQFNVVLMGPVDGAPGPEPHVLETIIGTLHKYLSLGCMGCSKKANYTIFSGFSQIGIIERFLLRLIMECYTYGTEYISVFNSCKDIIMKHIGGVFANNGTNGITDAIVAMWKWDEFFQGNPDLILKNPTLIPQVKEKLKRNRECMHKCVEALFDPMLGALDDARLREMVKPDIYDSAKFTESQSSWDSSLSRTSSAASSQASAVSYGSHPSDMSYDPKYSQGSVMNSSEMSDGSVSPRLFPLESTAKAKQSMEASRGGSSIKKTRKYRIKHKSNNNRRKRTRKNMKRNMKRTITNKKSRFNMNTRKIKNRRFYKNK
jgi:hypothetical protein